jgi:hypothetical protein
MPLPGDTTPAPQSRGFRRCHHAELRQLSGHAINGGEGAQTNKVLEPDPPHWFSGHGVVHSTKPVKQR